MALGTKIFDPKQQRVAMDCNAGLGWAAGLAG